MAEGLDGKMDERIDREINKRDELEGWSGWSEGKIEGLMKRMD